MSLSYSDYCNYYANKCDKCNGKKRVLSDKIWFACICQEAAYLKWKVEQIQVSPISLRYKEWHDFTGMVGEKNITDALSPDSLLDAKKKSMEYCFGLAGVKGPSDRPKYSIIKQRINDGINVIISGSKNSGKSLLACLISKEAIRARINTKWIHFSNLSVLAKWNQEKPIEYNALDELASIPLLVIDGIDLVHGSYGDLITLDRFFHNRHKPGFSTILLCSKPILKSIEISGQILREKMGKEFLSLIEDEKNITIELSLQSE